MKLWELWQQVTHVGQTQATGDTPIRVIDEGGNCYELTKIVFDKSLRCVWVQIRDE